jgi:RES domain-containing protein
LTFNAKQHTTIKRWISRATPLNGLFFRSVEYRYMDPIDVLSGAGTRAHGGRFAPTGTRAVYLSATDSGASKEVTARKACLGGVGQISTDKYPRVVYAVAVDLKKTPNLATLGSSQAAKAVREACLDKDEFERFDGTGTRTDLCGDRGPPVPERRWRRRQPGCLPRQLWPKGAFSQKMSGLPLSK